MDKLEVSYFYIDSDWKLFRELMEDREESEMVEWFLEYRRVKKAWGQYNSHGTR